MKRNAKSNGDSSSPLSSKQWTKVNIGEIVETQYGLSLAGNEHGTVPMLGMKNIVNGKIVPTNATMVCVDDTDLQGYSLKKGDLLFNRTNSLDLVGKTAIYDLDSDDHVVFASYLIRLSVDRFRATPEYVCHFLNSESSQQRLKDMATPGVSQYNINPTTFRKHFQITLPPLAEQKAIAGVLSAWDRAIEQTTALIAAKQRVKQGLMQQLFGEAAHSQRQLESKLCHLGDVASETTRRNGGGLGTDAVYSVTKANGMIPMPVDTIGSDIARYKLVRPKAFAYNPMRINIGSIARWEGESEVLVSPDYVVFECGPELDPDYLNHFRRGHVWDSYVKRSGDGSVRVRIYFDHLSRMRIRLPGIQEQRRIAKVLDAATAELRLLERKLNALKQQKRGLMQQLLTGTRRIPPAILRRFSHD